MTATAALLSELRLLRAMGDAGRAAAVTALRSARLGRRPENPHPPAGAAASTASTEDDPMKLMAHKLDAAIVARGGASIFTCRPSGTLSPEAEQRLAAWTLETPRRHSDATGRKPKDEW